MAQGYKACRLTGNCGDEQRGYYAFLYHNFHNNVGGMCDNEQFLMMMIDNLNSCRSLYHMHVLEFLNAKKTVVP